jgi:hypothetical protein
MVTWITFTFRFPVIYLGVLKVMPFLVSGSERRTRHDGLERQLEKETIEELPSQLATQAFKSVPR